MGEYIAGRKNLLMSDLNIENSGFSSGDPSPVSLFPPVLPDEAYVVQKTRTMSPGTARKTLRNVLRRAESPNFTRFVLALITNIILGDDKRISFSTSGEYGFCIEICGGTFAQAVNKLIQHLTRDIASRLKHKDMPYWVFSHIIKAPFSFACALGRFEINGSEICSDDDIFVVTEFFG